MSRTVTGGALALALLACSVGCGARSQAARKPARPVARGAVPAFDRVVVIVFENKEPDQVLGNEGAPNFDRLARRYAALPGYVGVAHPSLPNYLALVSGTTGGITSDCTSCTVSAVNLADTLPAAGRSWKTYAEGLPSPGYTGGSAGRYAKKHDPFLYFDDVLARGERRRRVVPLSQFSADLDHDALPAFSLVIPDLCHDMHDCSVAIGDRWLGSFVAPLLRSRALRNGVVFVVFDEGDGSDTAGGGGHVPALALGPLVRPGAHAAGRLDHYSLLRTIEQAWHLPLLGRSADAIPIGGIWRSARPR